jgi:putative transcriptional regulator
MVSYEPLFETLEEKGLKMNDLRSRGILHGTTAAKLKRDEMVTFDKIIEICIALDVPIERVVRIKHP